MIGYSLTQYGLQCKEMVIIRPRIGKEDLQKWAEYIIVCVKECEQELNINFELKRIVKFLLKMLTFLAKYIIM